MKPHPFNTHDIVGGDIFFFGTLPQSKRAPVAAQYEYSELGYTFATANEKVAPSWEATLDILVAILRQIVPPSLKKASHRQHGDTLGGRRRLQ